MTVVRQMKPHILDKSALIECILSQVEVLRTTWVSKTCIKMMLEEEALENAVFQNLGSTPANVPTVPSPPAEPLPDPPVTVEEPTNYAQPLVRDIILRSAQGTLRMSQILRRHRTGMGWLLDRHCQIFQGAFFEEENLDAELVR